MKTFAFTSSILAALILTGCADTATAPSPDVKTGLIGNWQSVEDANYMLKLNSETYREFYEDEEMSRDQWQPVKSCDDPQPVEKSAPTYGGFQIWTIETDSRICYTISNWTADKVSLTYAGTTSTYTRSN